MGQVTVQKVVEGQSHLVLRVDLAGDGTGELENYVILSPMDLNPPKRDVIPAFRIMQIWYGMVWFDVTFKAGSVVPRTLWALARDCDSHVDFRSFGGLIDPVAYTSPTADDDGKLLMSTNGFNVAGSAGTIVLELRKTNQASA